MSRVLIIECNQKINQKVRVCGWIWNHRDHGKIIFLDLIDRSGILQVVCPQELAEQLNAQDVVNIEGTVTQRPTNLINPNIPTGNIELQAESIQVLSKADILPFELAVKDLNLQLPTLLDYRTLTLRHPKEKAIFQVQAALMEGFRQASQKLGCTEIFAPTISASSTEGGAEVFKFDYFGHEAFLVQSPQLYKQMMVGVFERVYLTSHIYRAEPSVTTRHLVESIQLDVEVGFIENFTELLEALEFVFVEMIKYAQQNCSEQLKLLEVPESKVQNKIPRLTFHEALELVSKRTGVDRTKELDLSPEDERELAEWAKAEYDSDLVTVTHFPTKKRAFYSHPDPANPEVCLSYDLIYKGLEVSSGAQRIHDYQELLQVIQERGMNPDNFAMYLQAFKYGMPPHGGFSYGLERTTMKLLNLENIREASLFPRDIQRVDFTLATLEQSSEEDK